MNYNAPYFKTFLLLQAHFSHLQLPPDLVSDQALVLGKVLNLLAACVDVMSSNVYLNALGAMDLSQMCVQAMWETDSPLKQILHFNPDVRVYPAFFCANSNRCRWSITVKMQVWNWFMILWKWRMTGGTGFCKRMHDECEPPKF
jgi:Sec63 Brl domain